MRVGIYARVSTLRQAQQQTIEQQLERLHQHVHTQGWELKAEHIFRDDGYSGTTLNRPCRTSGDSANAARALISASVFGFAIALPTLIVTFGVLGSLGSTDTTDAVPTALFSSPV